ncbi:MAG: adenylate/guanylate cyclase domain-containing protein [Deltaproteobacteria bacterium]|nr:adenylate/guanylate cyclase domain-containing protein [Deltaproteobacteria bacterium]
MSGIVASRAYLSRLVSYAPGHMARIRLEDPSRRGSWAEVAEGSLLVADFSGFTRLSEALGEMGRQGATVLADILNRYFEMLIDDVGLRRGGELIGFGGDGFTLLFLEGDHARNAVAAGLEIQEAMALCAEAETPLGTFPLALRVGIATGPVFQALLGTGGGAEVVIGGPTVEAAVRLQQACARGSVLISERTRERAGEGLAARPCPGGDDRRLGFDAHVVEELEPLPPHGEPFDWRELLEQHLEEAGPILEPFVDPGVLPLIQAAPEAPRIEATYAPATALFMRVQGVPLHGGAEVLPTLVELTEALSAVLEPVGVPLRKTDVSEAGIKMILIFGPPAGAETHVLDAALTASVIRTGLAPTRPRTAPFSGLEVRFGLATGSVWAGEVGSRRRREYSAIGDAVNLAARLADRAEPWEILCTEEIARAADPYLQSEDRGPLAIRGKAREVPCHRILPPR